MKKVVQKLAKSDEPESKFTAFPLPGGWWVVSNPDGSSLIMYLGAVLDAVSRNIVDVRNNPELLQKITHDNVYVRTIQIMPDGSIQCDPLGVSPKGIPREGDAYVIFESAKDTFSRFHASLGQGSGF